MGSWGWAEVEAAQALEAGRGGLGASLSAVGQSLGVILLSSLPCRSSCHRVTAQAIARARHHLIILQKHLGLDTPR
jgi:hypothetical protein